MPPSSVVPDVSCGTVPIISVVPVKGSGVFLTVSTPVEPVTVTS